MFWALGSLILPVSRSSPHPRALLLGWLLSPECHSPAPREERGWKFVPLCCRELVWPPRARW